MNYVIIGNGPAGTKAILAIREVDAKGKISLISDEPYLNYSRPLISYLLGKKVEKEAMPYFPKDFYKENRVELILNKKATGLDTKKKQITLSDKQKIHFGKLLIATGGRPIIPEIKGKDLSGVFTFTKWEDAEKIAQYIKDNKVKEAVVVGGGLIGLKATEALIGLRIKVTIIELADRILSATFDKKASNIIEKALEKTGCQILTNNTIVEIREKNKKVKGIILEERKEVPAKLVIVAIGVRPNIELVENRPIKVNKGILVDKHMQTNIKDIYAAGDCSEAEDLLLSITRPLAIWPVAVRQGKFAGFNMAGREKEYEGGFPMNSVELSGVPSISVGETSPRGKDFRVLESFAPEKSTYKKIVLKNGRIVGAIFVGDIERAGVYTGLIKDKVDTTGFQEHLLKEDFGLLSLPKEYRKHLVTGEAVII